MRDIIDPIDELRFQSQTEKHELSHLYEAKIKNMGNAGRNGGEYYTPRPLIRAIVAVIAPRLGETICAPAVGSAGFLCESFDYLKAQNPKRSTAQDRTLQERTFYGKEKKSLAYVIATMNMILHGIEAPNIILANPPFGGKERKEVQQNFPIRTGETAFLFLQHFIKILKAGGRAGIVIKNTFLSNTDNASVSPRQKLLEDCNLHTVLDCPGGTFIGAGVKTVVLFFEKGAKTRKVWYYQLAPGRNMGKTNPLNDNDLIDFIDRQRTFADSPKSWKSQVTTCGLRQPNGSSGKTRQVERGSWSESMMPFLPPFAPRFEELRLCQSNSMDRFAARVFCSSRKAVSVEFPAPKLAQAKIARELDEIEEETQRLARLYDQKLAALEALKKSLLHQAYGGVVR